LIHFKFCTHNITWYLAFMLPARFICTSRKVLWCFRLKIISTTHVYTIFVETTFPSMTKLANKTSDCPKKKYENITISRGILFSCCGRSCARQRWFPREYKFIFDFSSQITVQLNPDKTSMNSFRRFLYRNNMIGIRMVQ